MIKLEAGTRVELHPATDAWMRGDRYGVVALFNCRRRRHKNGTTYVPVMVRMDKSNRLLIEACLHGGGYPLDSEAARNEHDPRAGQAGVRCSDCGSVLSGFRWDGPVTVLVPCELPSAAT